MKNLTQITAKCLNTVKFSLKSSIKIKFPFNYSNAAKESETYDGYIAGEYLLDEKEFISVRISKE